MPLVFHWGGPRHGDVEEVPPERLSSSILVYDGPRWFGVYERFQPVQMQNTNDGPAELTRACSTPRWEHARMGRR